MHNALIALIGPTAVGKTAVSLELAQVLDAEIVCVDSVVVYKDFDIGTAKPLQEEQRQVRHHLINLVSPVDPFTAADFCREATHAISDIHARGKRVLLVGGCGLYLKAFTRGMFEIPPIDPSVGEALKHRLETEGLPSLYGDLMRIDPGASVRIHPHDTYRILRALEVVEGTGKPMSAYEAEHEKKRDSNRFQITYIGLDRPRRELHALIDLRIRTMIQQGLMDEVRQLAQRYPAECKPFKSVGYKEALAHLAEGVTQETLVEKISQQTRALAKRQLTWFRSSKEIEWFYPSDIQGILKGVQSRAESSRIL